MNTERRCGVQKCRRVVEKLFNVVDADGDIYISMCALCAMKVRLFGGLECPNEQALQKECDVILFGKKKNERVKKWERNLKGKQSS